MNSASHAGHTGEYKKEGAPPRPLPKKKASPKKKGQELIDPRANRAPTNESLIDTAGLEFIEFQPKDAPDGQFSRVATQAMSYSKKGKGDFPTDILGLDEYS